MEHLIIERTVTEDMLAVNVGSGCLRVLATPTVIALMEEASTKIADTLNCTTTTFYEIRICWGKVHVHLVR